MIDTDSLIVDDVEEEVAIKVPEVPSGHRESLR